MPFPIFNRSVGQNFPEVIGSTTFADGGALPSSVNMPLPSGVSGDLLLVIPSLYHGTAARTVSMPTGWSALYNEIPPNVNFRRAAMFFREADGTEGASVTVSSNGASSWAIVAHRIRGQSAAPTASFTTGTSTTPDPPNHSPGAGNYLWLAVAHVYLGFANNDFTSDPSNYTDPVSVRSELFTNFFTVATRTTRRILKASSENPGPYGVSANLSWLASTVAIKG